MSLPLLLPLLLGPAGCLGPQEAPPGAQASRPAPGGSLVPRRWLVLPPVDGRGRRPFRPDAVFARHLLDPGAPAPEAGQEVVGETGRASWEWRDAGEDGTVPGPAGWATTVVEVDRDRVLLAELQGASTLFVGGDAQAGDLYRHGFGGLPVALRQGPNRLWVTGIRGSFRLRLRDPGGALVLGRWDVLVPDLPVGGPVAGEAAALVLDASLEPAPLLHVVAGGVGPFRRRRSLVTWGLEPLHLSRVPLLLRPREGHPPPEEPAVVQLYVSLGGHLREDPRVHWLPVRFTGPTAPRRVVFRSRVDGSLQEYALLPPAGEPADWGPDTGLVLTLHGAGVDAMAQVRAYSRKQGLWIVAPTNRRPYGFDWQDWGRIDAYEVLADALRRTGADPRRVYLTGHSMGGHGVWHLAVHDPDRFAAAAPSAGWASFASYTGLPEGKLADLWRAADLASDTFRFLGNLRDMPLYILHGEADDNVPLREAEALEAALKERKIPFTSWHQPGAGHWWDGDASPGVDCVDWPGIFELFARSRLPSTPPRVLDWTCADPGLDAGHWWLRAEQPREYGRPLHFRARWDPEARRVELRTENVRRFRVTPPGGEALAGITVDGADFPGPFPEPVWFLWREDQGWAPTLAGPWAREKRPERCGPFKRAFDHRFVLVYGTAGTPEETRELLARARYDAAVWWYRARGSARLASDREFLREDADEDFHHRNVILYGNADSNAAWAAVVPAWAPVEVRRGRIRLGRREFRGDDLGCLFVLPRAGEDDTLVGAFADTGPRGSRLGYVLAPFVSGVGYPDYVVFSPEILTLGDGGVLAAGFFDQDWDLSPGVAPPSGESSGGG